MLGATLYNAIPVPQTYTQFLANPLVLEFRYNWSKNALFRRLQLQRAIIAGDGTRGTVKLGIPPYRLVPPEFMLYWGVREMQMRKKHGDDFIGMGTYMAVIWQPLDDAPCILMFTFPMLHSVERTIERIPWWERRLLDHTRSVAKYT